MDYKQRMPTPAETIVIALRSCNVINRKKNRMTPEELYERMRKELEETRELYRQGVDVLLEKIKNTTESAPAGGRLYTAFDVIRLVQEATSNEICGLGAEEASIAFEVERSIIQKLAKEENA